MSTYQNTRQQWIVIFGTVINWSPNNMIRIIEEMGAFFSLRIKEFTNLIGYLFSIFIIIYLEALFFDKL